MAFFSLTSMYVTSLISMPTVVLMLFAGQGTRRTDGRANTAYWELFCWYRCVYELTLNQIRTFP